MQSDLTDSKIFPNSPSFPMEHLLSSSLINSSQQPDASLKLKDFNQTNLLTVPGNNSNDKAQPEVFASFRNPENEIVVNNESKESEGIKEKDGVDIPGPLKEENAVKVTEASIESKGNLEQERKIVQSREKMENDTIKFKSDTIQEDNTSIRPETKQQQKNIGTSIEIEIKGQETLPKKDQIESPVKEIEKEKEGTLTLLPIGSPKKVVQKQLQPQGQGKLNNNNSRITQKSQKSFAEDSRLNRSTLESRGDRYQEEPRLKFLEFDKGPEARKRTEPTKEFQPFHLAKGNPIKNRNTSLPPLNNNKGGEESVTPSNQDISRGSFVIAGNFQSANVSCIESQYNKDNNSPGDDESVDLTRLNNILRAKLKPGSRAKLIEDATSDKEDSENFIPKLFEKFMNKNNGKIFAHNVGNTPYMDHLPQKGRGFSAKKGSDRYVMKGKNPNTSLDKRPNLTENYNSDEESSTVMHSRNLQRIYDKVTGTPEEIPPRLNTSENRTRNIKRVYNPAYLDKKLPKNNAQSTLKATLNAKNPFTLGAASNLIKPEVQSIQEKPKPKTRAMAPAKTHLATPSNNNPWDSMMSDKSKATPNSTTNMAKKRSSSLIGDNNAKGGQLTTNASGVLTPKKSFKNLSHSRSGSAEKLWRMDSQMLVRQAYRVKTNVGGGKDTESRDNSANRSVTDALNATRNYINKLMKNNKRGDSFDYRSTFEKKGMGFSKAERNPTGLVLEDTSPGPAYNLSSYKGILGTEKGLNLKDSSPTRKATENNNRSNSRANLHQKAKEVVLLINNKAVKTFQSQNGSEKSNNLTDRNKTVTKGVPFGKAKRDPLFGGPKVEAPGPGNYDLPKTKQSAAAPFGKEKREPLIKLKL